LRYRPMEAGLIFLSFSAMPPAGLPAMKGIRCRMRGAEIFPLRSRTADLRPYPGELVQQSRFCFFGCRLIPGFIFPCYRLFFLHG
jgi:hypothetical protein